METPQQQAISLRPASLSTSIITRPAGVSPNPNQRQLEMRLMYHYTQFAALELPATYGYSSKELWLDKVPQMAFESDLLLDSLLTVAALHMQDLMPEDHKLVRGCCALHRQYDGWLSQAGYDPGAVWLLAPGGDIVEADHPLLHDIKQDIEKLLEAFHVSTMPTEEANVYQDTADCVISLYMALVAGMGGTILQRLVFTMAVRMKSRYGK
ncbi:hypothetical protein ONZ43_g5197 [Nemania bipapillata]|uniref:Uncharacterized protein n=1 Tax=Nemania bipapillata TaxID=110536 RepID=A0ACC2IDK3_9PEZI|nr:hypothetical protein ONZ43_g5197 [Nemania bipapillata]